MTQEEQVLIRGKCFLYRQKAPFVPSGESIYGALEYRESSDEVRCHECGGWYHFLPTHIFRTHAISCAEYRHRHGLRRRCALCGPRMCCKIKAGKEEYYQRLREAVRSPEKRAEFGAMSRATANLRQRGSDTAERLNESGHCRAQLTQRLKELHAIYGAVPTNKQLIKHGISPASVCLSFNLPTITDVLKSLELTRMPSRAAYTREELIEALRNFHAKYGKLPGKAHERMGLIPRWRAFKRVFGSTTAAYEAAGLARLAVRSPAGREAYRNELIQMMRAFYRKHGEMPKPSRKYGSKDAMPPGFPSRKVFRRLFGSMAAAYEAAARAGFPAAK